MTHHLRGQFLNEVRGRLDAGEIEYGDRSFDRSVDDLLAETEEELLDVAGWAYVGWVRIRRLRSQAVVRAIRALAARNRAGVIDVTAVREELAAGGMPADQAHRAIDYALAIGAVVMPDPESGLLRLPRRGEWAPS